MILDYLKFAWSSLTNKKLRSWLTLLGILIGVTAVVSLIGLGEGLKAAVSSQFGVSSTEVISVQAGGISGQGPPGSGVVNPLTTKDVHAIERLSTVDFAVSRVIEQGKVEFNDALSFGFAMNVPSGEHKKFVYDALGLDIENGRFLRDDDGKKVNLGANYAKSDNSFKRALKVGDIISFKEEDFEVAGILEKQGSFIFDNIIIINEEELQKLLDDPDRIDVIAVKVKNKDLMDEAKEDIEKALRKTRDVNIGEEDFSVETPEQALETVNSVLSGVQAFIALIAGVSIVVGAIGIVNTMTTSVLERRQQIGIMKAIGARNSDIFYQFFIESGMMGLIGGIIGVIFGETIAFMGTIGLNNFLGADISPSLNVYVILFTLIGTFLIGAFAGIVPAMQAARENPVDALRD